MGRWRPRCHYLPEGVAFEVRLDHDVALRLLLSLLGVLYAGGGAVLQREIGAATLGMWLGNYDAWRAPPPSWLDCFGVLAFVGAGQRIKFGSLVGEESELPRVGCIEAW
jgi:hypothetical protein